MLEVFPGDAAAIRYGQKVRARLHSLPGQEFDGRVAFIDPHVDPQTRTVGVRVVMPNEDGRLRVGDYATATIDVQSRQSSAGRANTLYDPELAHKFISPRHPHIIADHPGTCPRCGVALVPASELGYSPTPVQTNALVVPRSSVLSAGEHSVVYVETEPGRFEIRPVVLGPNCGDQVVIVEGLTEEERVAVRGAFLIDSQMQLAGNPSLIDPTKAKRSATFEWDEADLPPISAPQPIELPAGRLPNESAPNEARAADKITAALNQLAPADRVLAERQQVCPVADMPLGSMGTPIKIDVRGRPVFICCEGCRDRLLGQPQKYLAKLPKETVQ